MANLAIVRGDSISYNVNFTYDSGSAVNITNYIIFFTVKKSFQDNDSSALISKTISNHINPTGGETIISLNTTDTEISPGKYVYDIQYKNDSNNIKTPMGLIGDFIVLPDVSRRTS
jgi:hypothetical protein